MFNVDQSQVIRVSMSDPTDPLASFSRHAVSLDGADWPSVEHYFQGMKFQTQELRESVLGAIHPADARKIAKKHRREIRNDWKQIEETIMTRGVYIKCRSHDDAAAALLATGARRIIETSQYDYYWGCGRDGRGNNAYSKVLMTVRKKLRAPNAT
ncbi:MAG: NADAR family protein [Thiohalocapsa sp.]